MPPVFDDYESMCPGLELGPELIPPYFETDVELIPDPGPFEVCLLLAQELEAHSEASPSVP